MKITGYDFVEFLQEINNKLSQMEFGEMDFEFYKVPYLHKKIDYLIKALNHTKGHIEFVESHRRKP